jgi:hypothetical protein
MFDPAEFAKLANQLGDDDNYTNLAARTRTSLGRAYYALMLAVRVTIRNAQKRSPDLGFGDHGHLWRTLEDSGVPQLMSLGKALKDLYEARQKADYHVDPPEPKWVTKLADPRFGRMHAEIAKDAISRLPHYDFTPVLGKV